jgi:predicted dienelactone hydrolase
VIQRRHLLILCLIAVVVLCAQTRPRLTRAAGQLPLAGAGPYSGGVTVVTLADGARAGAKLAVSIWYPAEKAAATPSTLESGPAMLKESSPLKANPTLKSPSSADLDAGTLLNVIEVKGRWTHVEAGDAKSGWVLSENVMSRPTSPDKAGAPYPLILYSHGLGGSRWDDPGTFLHLASHGYVVASIDHTCDPYPTCLIDRPLDILFVLDQLTGISTGDLAGMITGDRAGVIGASYGGYTALATTGARIDPDYFLNWYAHRTLFHDASIDVIDSYGRWNIADEWKNIAAYWGKFHPLEPGQAWPPITDPRIRAVLPIVPAGTTVSGERGLEAATVPTLIMAGTDDGIVPYSREIVPLYNHFGAKDHYLLTLVGYTHSTYLEPNWGGYYRQFATAFFGYYLQGRQDYAGYLTSAYIGGFSDLAWGVYQKP